MAEFGFGKLVAIAVPVIGVGLAFLTYYFSRRRDYESIGISKIGFVPDNTPDPPRLGIWVTNYGTHDVYIQDAGVIASSGPVLTPYEVPSPPTIKAGASVLIGFPYQYLRSDAMDTAKCAFVRTERGTVAKWKGDLLLDLINTARGFYDIGAARADRLVT